MNDPAQVIESNAPAADVGAPAAPVKARRWPAIVLLVWAVLLAVMEWAAYRGEGKWIVLAAYTWVAWSAVAIGAGFIFIIRALWDDVKSRCWLNLVCLAVAVGCLGWGIGQPAYALISNEAAQQVGAGLANAKKENLGYLETAFLGYPSRQYLLTAVPALLGGRTWLNLHLGYLWLIVSGLGVFYAGLRAALRQIRPEMASRAGLVALAIYTFPYQLNFARHFEQVALPPAFVMHAVGWLLLARLSPGALRIVALAWSGTMLAMCYSPGVAAWCLLLALLGLWILESLRRRDWTLSMRVGAALLPMLAHGLCFYLIVAPGGPFKPRANLEISATVFATLQNLFFNFFGDEWWGPPMAFFPVIFALPIVIYLVYAICGRLGWPHAAVGWWTLGTIFAGVFLAGYTDYPIHFSLQRANVVVPPLVAGATLAGAAWFARTGYRLSAPLGRLLAFLVAANVMFNTNRSIDHYQRKVYNLAGDFLEDVDAQLKEAGLDPRTPVTFILLSGFFEINNPPFAEFAYYRFNDFKLILADDDIPPPDDPGFVGRAVLVYVDEGLHPPNLERLLGDRRLRKIDSVMRDRRMLLRRGVYPPGTFGKPAPPTAENADKTE